MDGEPAPDLEQDRPSRLGCLDIAISEPDPT